MPKISDYTEKEAFDLIKDYVEPKECATSLLPRDLKPEIAGKYLSSELRPDFNLLYTERAAELARYYARREGATNMHKLMADNVSTNEDYRKLCHQIVVVAELGTEPLQTHAVEAHTKLIRHRLTQEDTENARILIESFFSLPKQTSPDELTKRIKAIRRSCEKNGPEGQLSEWVEYDVSLVPWTLGRKHANEGIHRAKDSALRLRKWADVYLMAERTPPYEWYDSAGYCFLAEARQRVDGAAVTALKETMATIDEKKTGEEFAKSQWTRGYRARAYFLEVLEEEEERFRDEHMVAQHDLIM